MDYKKSALEVLEHIGGNGNIVSAAHCATRLRLVIADNTKCSREALENIDGVKGVLAASAERLLQGLLESVRRLMVLRDYLVF